jgi:hypothetical protein
MQFKNFLAAKAEIDAKVGKCVQLIITGPDPIFIDLAAKSWIVKPANWFNLSEITESKGSEAGSFGVYKVNLDKVPNKFVLYGRSDNMAELIASRMTANQEKAGDKWPVCVVWLANSRTVFRVKPQAKLQLLQKHLEKINPQYKLGANIGFVEIMFDKDFAKEVLTEELVPAKGDQKLKEGFTEAADLRGEVSHDVLKVKGGAHAE